MRGWSGAGRGRRACTDVRKERGLGWVEMGKIMPEAERVVCPALPDRARRAACGLAFGGVRATVRVLSFGAWRSLRVL